MNYKNIIKSRSTRIKLLRLLSFVPDQAMLKLQYRIHMGRKLNLKNPQRFTEKIQWYKLNYKNPDLIVCVDKYEVRQYLFERGFSDILNECYGVYNSVDEIDFDSLPDSFVIKDTLGGGGNSVIPIKNKEKTDLEDVKKRSNAWTKAKPSRGGGREWPYYSGKGHRIIIEKYLECANGDLPDFKFYCFDGRCECFYIRIDYAGSHNDGKLTFFDSKKNKLNVSLDYCGIMSETIDLPENIDEMIEYAELISKGFPHCRVDLYNIDGKIIFGEMTFYNASGYFEFTPDSYDYELGKKFIIENI